jgi:hypothetical protein
MGRFVCFLPVWLASGTLVGCANIPPEEITPTQMMEATVGSSGKLLAQYLAPRYRGYAKPVHVAGRDTVYVRHTGRDFGMPPGTEVRALTPGMVVALLGNAARPASLATIVADNDRHWVYGHIFPETRLGQMVGRGQVIGKIVDPLGAFPPHVHITTITVSFPTRNSEVNDAIGWGRAYGKTPQQAEANALRYTDDPLEAYACSLGEPCWLIRVSKWWSAHVGR